MSGKRSKAGLAQYLDAAQSFARQGRLADAEQSLLQAVHADRRNPLALEALTDFYLQTSRPSQAAQVLERLIAISPGQADYYFRLAAVLDKLGQSVLVPEVYRRLVTQRPELAVAHFNLACYLKRSGALAEAIAEHRRALELGIDAPAEVCCNIGVIYGELHQHEAARAALQQSLDHDPQYIPALYNLGLLHEEFGEKEQALGSFRAILAIAPDYHDALMRIAHLQACNECSDPLISQLQTALGAANLNPLAREGLHFALGKLLDECGSHAQAFAQFQQGNRIARARLQPFDRNRTEQLFQRIMHTFDDDWRRAAPPVSEAPLLFICGMFRSGSTLAEQIVAAHPDVTAGGEINWLNSRLQKLQPPFPESLRRTDTPLYRELGTAYISYLQQLFPEAALVSNKRPDNFLYLGLLSAMYPNARFVHTLRDPLDTCLSIYFQQLGDELDYSAELEHIALYYLQYRRLMQYWQAQFGERIFTLDYDALVADPETSSRELMRFLELDWHPDCLRFWERDNRVRTASLWQVRQPLHSRSCGRWRHYAQHIEPARLLLSAFL